MADNHIIDRWHNLTPQERDVWVAADVMGQREGVEFGTAPEHDWERDEDGQIDMWAWDSDDGHAGPLCKRCVYTYCGGCENGRTDGPCVVSPRRFTQDITDAWLVVERMREKGKRLHLMELKKDMWQAEFLPIKMWFPSPAETEAEAICLAALLELAGRGSATLCSAPPVNKKDARASTTTD